MNDDFLTHFRKAPRPGFAAELYQRINTPMNPKRNIVLRRFTFAAAICMALVAALAFSPAVRAAFNGLFREIGGVTYLDPEEDPNQQPLSESEITLVPEERLPLEQARTRVPFEILLPEWTPEGYTMSQTVRITYFPYEPTNGTNPFVYLSWYSQDIGGQLELVVSQPVNWVVDMDHIEEVQVNGQPAALLRGNWSADTGGWETTYGDLTLTWKLGDVMYRLSSNSLTVEDLIRMAESVQ